MLSFHQNGLTDYPVVQKTETHFGNALERTPHSFPKVSLPTNYGAFVRSSAQDDADLEFLGFIAELRT
jgi:hypothetical protein